MANPSHDEKPKHGLLSCIFMIIVTLLSCSLMSRFIGVHTGGEGDYWHLYNGTKIINNDINCTLLRESLIYLKECIQEWNDTGINVTYIWPLLITATPRSGTVFTYSVLNYLGIKVTKDSVSPTQNHFGQISWINAFYESDENKYFGRSRLNGGRFRTIFHQIRDPLAGISSICTIPYECFIYIKRHVPLINITRYQYYHKTLVNTKMRILLNMQFWYEWNMALNKFGFDAFYIEDLFDFD
eukprot:169665_1